MGYIIKHECPLEWGIIQNVRQAKEVSITAELIERLTYTSDNDIFKTERFRRALLDFKEYGFLTPNKKEFDLDDELRYIKDKLNNTKRLE